ARHRRTPRRGDRPRPARGRRGPSLGRPAPFGTKHGTNPLRLLVVDDEEGIRGVLTTLLEKESYPATPAAAAAGALAVFDAESFDVVLLDLMLPDRSGLEVLREIRRKDPDAVVVIVTAYSSIEGAIEAMRDGAFHYIPKPFKNQEVLLT